MTRTGLRVFLTGLIGLAALLAVAVMAARLGDEARFVTWPVVVFTALAAVVALVGMWTGSRRPALLAVGVLPAMVISYFLPAFPFPLVAVVLVGMALAAIAAAGVASGIAAGTGLLMIVFVVLQGPAVECGVTSVSSNSGPWWIDEPSQSTSSGTATAEADASSSRGTTQVGGRRYSYECRDGRLASFERVGDQGASTG